MANEAALELRRGLIRCAQATVKRNGAVVSPYLDARHGDLEWNRCVNRKARPC